MVPRMIWEYPAFIKLFFYIGENIEAFKIEILL